MNVTLASWRQTWEQAGAASVDDSLFHLLVACYSEKHRHYHTLQHLRECFELFDEAKGMAGRPAEIGLALWFHDAIYDVRRYDNEARSADMAAASIRAAGLADDVGQRVHMLIMATCHDLPPADPDAQLLTDIDLSILGAQPRRFDESDKQIHAEFAHLPWSDFREGRKRVLYSFLERPRLYNTDRFYAAYELQARANLHRSLSKL